MERISECTLELWAGSRWVVCRELTCRLSKRRLCLITASCPKTPLLAQKLRSHRRGFLKPIDVTLSRRRRRTKRRQRSRTSRAQSAVNERKRLTNTPVRRAWSVLKCPDDRKNRVVSAQATYPCGSSAVGGRVCEQRYAAERVLPESRFELQHSGSPSKETALEEKA